MIRGSRGGSRLVQTTLDFESYELASAGSSLSLLKPHAKASLEGKDSNLPLLCQYNTKVIEVKDQNKTFGKTRAPHRRALPSIILDRLPTRRWRCSASTVAIPRCIRLPGSLLRMRSQWPSHGFASKGAGSLAF